MDEECDSRVCESGACLSEAIVVYAAPGGSDASNCTQVQPCSLFRAVTVATAAIVPPTIRLLPGLYANQLAIGNPTNGPLKIVATGASITSFSGVLVTGGANVDIRNITVSGSNEAVMCGEPSAPISTLLLRSSLIVASRVVASRCNLRIETTEIRSPDIDNVSALALDSDTVFSGDRIHIHGSPKAIIGVGFNIRQKFQLTNSLLENAIPLLSTFDSGPPGSDFLLGFNTFVMNTPGLRIPCQANSGSANRRITYENNIIVVRGAASAVDGTDCALSNNILLPQPTPPAGNIVADPQFVAESARDFRLMSTSPAIDAASPSAIQIDHDFNGSSRPPGSRRDIGAFEHQP